MKSGDVEMQCDYAQIIPSSILIWHICVTFSLFTSCYVYFSCPTTVIFSCKFTGFVREISLSWIKTKKTRSLDWLKPENIATVYKFPRATTGSFTVDWTNRFSPHMM